MSESDDTGEGIEDGVPASDDGLDPFSAEYSPKLQLIVQMRIYDALMSILTLKDREAGTKLHELHDDGKILYSLPYINMTDD